MVRTRDVFGIESERFVIALQFTPESEIGVRWIEYPNRCIESRKGQVRRDWQVRKEVSKDVNRDVLGLSVSWQQAQRLPSDFAFKSYVAGCIWNCEQRHEVSNHRGRN